MSYLGNAPALAYTSFAKQDFTVTTTTSYSLDHPVANENEIALFINFVRQEPSTSYSASGTTLTLTEATSSSDDMYCVFLGKAVQTVNPPNASVGLSQLTASGTKNSTTFLRGDNTFAVAGGTNTPAFSVRLNSAQAIPNSTYTKIAFNGELYDTDNAFDNSTNYRFTVPSDKAGKYFFYFGLQYLAYNGARGIVQIKKNGTEIHSAEISDLTSSSNPTINSSFSLDLSVGDYIELFGYQNTGSTQNIRGGTTELFTYFGGYKIIE